MDRSLFRSRSPFRSLRHAWVAANDEEMAEVRLAADTTLTCDYAINATGASALEMKT
jgi:hypothetical protein